MKQVRLGDTGLSVSPIGFGTVKLGRSEGVKYPTAFRIPDDREAVALLELARELGINLLDTAPAYGNSEERLGSLMPGSRGDWVICTKVGEEFRDGQSFFDFTPEGIEHSLRRSMARLGTDYLDLVLVHSDGNDMEIIQRYGVLEKLAELKARGWLRASGMSTKTVEGGIATLERADVAMVTYNLQHREEEAVLDHARDAGKGILVKKALASGHICAGGMEDPLTASMNFVFGHAGVSSVIIGSINPEHIRANVAAAEAAIDRHRLEE